jgi:hypothetical protein
MAVGLIVAALVRVAASTGHRRASDVVAWHRRGLRLFWTWKSRHRTGRPPVPREVRELIRTMSQSNPLWGSPRIHGELLKLGINVWQATVAKYMPAIAARDPRRNSSELILAPAPARIETCSGC